MQSYTYNLTRTILYVGVGSLPLLSDQRVVLSNAAAWQPVPYTVTCQLSELRAAGVARPSGSVILRAILIPIIIPILILISTWSRVNSASCARQGWRGRACNWIWTRAWIWMLTVVNCFLLVLLTCYSCPNLHNAEYSCSYSYLRPCLC